MDRFEIDFTPNLVLGPNGERRNGGEGTYYIYDRKNDCERVCYATSLENAKMVKEALNCHA